MISILRLTLFLLLVLPCTYSFAEQTGGCHCFRNRTFDPAERFAADDYFLTTVFNSLTAYSFSIEKRQIVMLKMRGGIRNEDLLIGLYIADKEGAEPAEILAEKKNGTWRQFLAGREPAGPVSRDPLYRHMLEGMPDTEIAGEITREMLRKRFAVTPAGIDNLKGQDFTLREIALILALAEHVDADPAVIVAQYRTRGHSWSEIAHNFGLQPAEAGKLVSAAKQ